MDIEKIISPDITGRKTISRWSLNPGDVVAFATENKGRLRTGLMVLSRFEKDWIVWAVNLYEEDGCNWVFDNLPTDDIIYFEPTREERIYGLLMSARAEIGVMTSNKEYDTFDKAADSMYEILSDVLKLIDNNYAQEKTLKQK